MKVYIITNEEDDKGNVYYHQLFGKPFKPQGAKENEIGIPLGCRLNFVDIFRDYGCFLNQEQASWFAKPCPECFRSHAHQGNKSD